MTDLTMLIVVCLTFFAVNVAIHLVFSLSISAHLQNRHSLVDEIKARRLSKIALFLGVIAAGVWTIISWAAFTYFYLPTILQATLTFGTLLLIGINYLIPIYLQERVCTTHFG